MNRAAQVIAPYPKGWFLIALAEEIATAEVRPLSYFGRDLVAYRSASGQVYVHDAHCPHLGAHLGHGGKVVGEGIRCPFHGWEWDGASGGCSRVPYADKIPPRAALRCWPVAEVSGLVLVYHDREGDPPSWQVPAIPHSDSPEWTAWRETRWTLRANIQDLNENDVDGAHMPVLHDFCVGLPEVTIEARGPQLDVSVLADIDLGTFGLSGTVRAPILTTKYGLSLGYIEHHVPLSPEITVGVRSLGSTVPIDAEHVDVRFFHSVQRRGIEGVDQMMEERYVASFTKALEADIPIWENKIYIPRPPLSEADGPIARYRKWAEQFYSAAELAQARGRG